MAKATQGKPVETGWESNLNVDHAVNDVAMCRETREIAAINGTFTLNNGTFTVSDGKITVSDGTFTLMNGTFTVSDGKIAVSDGTFTLMNGTFTVSDGRIAVINGIFTIINGKIVALSGTFAVMNVLSGKSVCVAGGIGSILIVLITDSAAICTIVWKLLKVCGGESSHSPTVISTEP